MTLKIFQIKIFYKYHKPKRRQNSPVSACHSVA